jgi:hypothetical protein
MRADEVRAVFESVDAQPSAMFSEVLLAQLRADYLRADFDASRVTHHLTLEPILIDVLHDEPRGGHEHRLERPNRPWSRHRRRIAEGVAAAAVIVAAIVFVRTGSDDGADVNVPTGPGPTATTNPSPPPLPDGLQGLPPAGATPSTPATGQLLAGLPIPIWVYEDGRVISARWTTHWTGLLEQRLTPEGVELVRAEIEALEPLEDCRAAFGNYGYGDGDRIVGETPIGQTGAGAETLGSAPGMCELPQYQRLSELQYGAQSWLPASAWADSVLKPYVPSSYQIQINSTDAPAVLAALPPDAAALLTAPTQCPALAGMSDWQDPSTKGPIMCFRVTTEEARQLGTALGIPPGSTPFYPIPPGFNMSYPYGGYQISALPYLPHEAPLYCCAG